VQAARFQESLRVVVALAASEKTVTMFLPKFFQLPETTDIAGLREEMIASDMVLRS
jgi:hypothetical protein